MTKLRSFSSALLKKNSSPSVAVCSTKKVQATIAQTASTRISMDSNQSACSLRSSSSCSMPMATASMEKPNQSNLDGAEARVSPTKR